MVQLRREDPASFQNFLRIQPEMFDELLARVGPRITKHDTNYRKALDPGTKLAATLRHLASGDTYASMKFDFRIPAKILSVLVKEVYQAIVDAYKDEVMQCPTTPDEWKAVGNKFEQCGLCLLWLAACGLAVRLSSIFNTSSPIIMLIM